MISDRIAPAGKDDGAGQFLASDGGLDERTDRRESGWRFSSGDGAGNEGGEEAGLHEINIYWHG